MRSRGWQVAQHKGDEGHDVDGTDPRVDALVAAQVDQVDCGPGQGAGGVGHDVGPAGQGEYGAVVVGIAVQVHQGGGGGVSQLAQDGLVPALRDVHHALHQFHPHCSSVACIRPPRDAAGLGVPARSPEARGTAAQDRGAMS